MTGFDHVTVLLHEAVDSLNLRPEGTYVDCTLGGGGHTREILAHLNGEGTVVAIDQDQTAITHAQQTLAAYEGHLVLVKRNFVALDQVLVELGIQAVDGILFDLGVSSPQFDEGERGFSYRFDAPLDMRMDQNAPVSAYHLVNELSEQELAQVMWEFGEERWAKRIAQFIVVAREQGPIETTGQLVEIIKKAVPAGARQEGPHPARRTFQALRIRVNNELDVLAQALDKAIAALAPGGRLAVITFHSLEDRIVKQTMAKHVNPCICPPRLPVCVCGRKPDLRVVAKKPIIASPPELALNPRARSAKLRVGEKLPCSSH